MGPRHIRASFVTLAPVGVVMAWLLTNDIPTALRRADISATQIQGALGVSTPNAHLASYVWTHPYLSLLGALILVLSGGALAWLLELAIARMKCADLRKPPPPRTAFWRRSKYASATQDEVSNDEMLVWQHRPEMALWQAAYLWVGETPKANYPADAPALVRVIAERMTRDAKAGSLVLICPFSPDKNPRLSFVAHLFGRSEYSTVTRDALIAYAKLRGEQPRFLATPPDASLTG